jgi:hypothetical protein
VIIPDTPQDFATEIQHNGHLVRYQGVLEIGQGGPCVGEITVDGIALFPGRKFGGPLLGSGDSIFAPILKRKFLGNFFSLAEVNLTTKALTDYELKEDLIYLDRIEEDEIIYYNTFNKSSKPMCLKRHDLSR